MPLARAAAAPRSVEPLSPAEPLVHLVVNGTDVEVPDDGASLLDVLRDRCGIRSVKDGCSPQGQCGCCTVWVDGAPRVACVTPVRRIDGRRVTTLEGLDLAVRRTWSEALAATGGSQCGFCTPGIILRLAAMVPASSPASTAATPAPDASPTGMPGLPGRIRQSLVAHLCRCTGWQTIEEAAVRVLDPTGAPAIEVDRSWPDAGRRATIEGGAVQRVGAEVALGGGGFADDTAPLDALVAVPDGAGSYAVGPTVREARALAGKVQGRRSTLPPVHPVPMPPGDWSLGLRTTWVEPSYVEPDASWCVPGGEPAAACANGGSFGGKRTTPVGEVARRLAAEHGRPVRVLWSREDVVRDGPKRPPVAIGMASDGSGVLRFGVSGEPWSRGQLDAVSALVASVAPGLELDPYPVVGPPVSAELRGALWVEAAVVDACRRVIAGGGPSRRRNAPVEVISPSGGRAVAECRSDGSLAVTVGAGEVLDPVVLRSYAIGAAHQALGWVTSEAIAVDGDGRVADLTVRSFGVLAARAMPRVDVAIEDQPGAPAVNGSDAVFAAVAAARWLADGLVDTWPTGSPPDGPTADGPTAGHAAATPLIDRGTRTRP